MPHISTPASPSPQLAAVDGDRSRLGVSGSGRLDRQSLAALSSSTADGLLQPTTGSLKSSDHLTLTDIVMRSAAKGLDKPRGGFAATAVSTHAVRRTAEAKVFRRSFSESFLVGTVPQRRVSQSGRQQGRGADVAGPNMKMAVDRDHTPSNPVAIVTNLLTPVLQEPSPPSSPQPAESILLPATSTSSCGPCTPTPCPQTFYKRALPPTCTAFHSPAGRALLLRALQSPHMEPYYPLSIHFTTQAHPAYCGLTTLVMCLNALGVDPLRRWKGCWRWFQEDMLALCKSEADVRSEGVTLPEFECLARWNGLDARAVRADGSEVGRERFREEVRRVTKNGDEFMVVSYSRRTLGQTGDGHFSPIGGYDEVEDKVLIFDVARFKYPPYWISLDLLWSALQPHDENTSRPRGYCLLKRPSSPRTHLHLHLSLNQSPNPATPTTPGSTLLPLHLLNLPSATSATTLVSDVLANLPVEVLLPPPDAPTPDPGMELCTADDRARFLANEGVGPDPPTAPSMVNDDDDGDAWANEARARPEYDAVVSAARSARSRAGLNVGVGEREMQLAALTALCLAIGVGRDGNELRGALGREVESMRGFVDAVGTLRWWGDGGGDRAANEAGGAGGVMAVR
ncbi:hypothetical protein HK101_001844 [Irineochytrium annulatum]|nr:hypothetical protein HK101_001844 [Irineochytrium annulatum]